MALLTAKIDKPMLLLEALSPANFTVILNGLGQRVAKLDGRGAQDLINAILRYSWLKPDLRKHTEFMSAYAQFLVVLVSLFPKYMQSITKKLFSEFCDVNPEEGQHHHYVLQRLIQYVPTSISTIPQTMRRSYPHHLSSSPKELVNYASNLLAIVAYCPELQYDAWRLVYELCIKLDVELQNELDDLDDEEIDEVLNPEVDSDDDDDVDDLVIRKGDDDDQNEDDEDDDADADNDADDDADGGSDEEENEGDDDGEEYFIDDVDSAANIRKLSAKLDGVLHHMLTTTQLEFTVEEINNGNGIKLFQTITLLFRLHVLPTHFTKLIQFLVFYISQHQPELAELFLVLLIEVALSPLENIELRLKAIQYLSLYLARARNVSREQVISVVLYLVEWLNKYIDERESEVGADGIKGGMERFKLFYAALQALFYIFCFRYKELYRQADAGGKAANDSIWECDLDKFFTRVIVTKFNPLKYCDETVVAIFAKLATKLNVCYCYTIIEHNKRERLLQTNGEKALPSAVGNFLRKQEFLDLEAYFPFDPLVLPELKEVINKWYVEWLEVNPQEEEDDDDGDLSDSS